MSRWIVLQSSELVVICFIALVISETNEFEIGPRYLMNGGIDPCGGRCQQGHCSPEGNGTFTCACFNGWAGTDCGVLAWATPANSGSHNLSSYCNHHSTWSGYNCVCLDNWSGDRCQYAPASTTVDHCNGHCVHGHCEPVYNDYGYVEYHHCRCDNNWHGLHCEEKYASTDPCFDKCVHGSCVQYFNNTYYCHCDDSWQGINCDSGTMLHCGDTYCMHGECVSTIGPHGPQNSHCECYHGWQGQTCEVSSTTTTTIHTLPPVTVSSTHSLSTMIHVTAAHAHGTCNKVSTVLDILQQNLVDDKNASLCPSGSRTSHEAFVLKNCPASSSPASWHPGAQAGIEYVYVRFGTSINNQVMTMCSCGQDSIPGYTAIAAFENGRYAAVGGLSGIFVACLADGFKMAVQRCDQPPVMKDFHVGGAFLDNPNVYFTIV